MRASQATGVVVLSAALVALAASFSPDNPIHRQLLVALSILAFAFSIRGAHGQVTRSTMQTPSAPNTPGNAVSPSGTSEEVRRAQRQLDAYFDTRINEEKLRCLSSIMQNNTRSEEADRMTEELERQWNGARRALTEAAAEGSPERIRTVLQRHLGHASVA